MIAILRNPVERLPAFFFDLRQEELLRDFSQALRKEEARICDNWSIFGTISRQGYYAVATVALPNLTRSRLEFIYLKTSTLTRWRYCRIFSISVSETFVPDISVKQNASVMPTNLASPDHPGRNNNSLKFIGKISGGSKTYPAGSSNWVERRMLSPAMWSSS